MHIKATYTLNVFVAYHPADKPMFDELMRHLSGLRKKNKDFWVNKVWYDGADLSETGLALLRELTEHADIILLLMSEHSVMSPYFHCEALRRTIELHEQERNFVIPVILTTCWWEDSPYRNLPVLPRAGLPIYDSTNVKNELFDQLVEELLHRIEKVRERKKLIEATFHAKVQEADALFEGWEQHPETLRMALPLYKESLGFWREGFLPARETIEQRIDTCQRELDFKHYARAAQEAYKAQDYRAAYFNCKDALALRDDAVIRSLYRQLERRLHEEDMRVLRQPFDKHLQKGHEYFLSLQWDAAEKEYLLALEFHEPGFVPTREVLLHKIGICHRERVLEDSLRRAEIAYRSQRYRSVVDILMEGIREIHGETFERIERVLRIVEDLEHVKPFCDQRSLKWGYYNTKTNSVIIAPKYIAAFNFSENLAGVRKWEKWGFIDIEGSEIIPFRYDFVGHFKNGLAEVIQDGQTFQINHRGDRVD